MIPEIRKKFNSEFKDETYNKFLNELNSVLKYPTDFRVCETPLFLSEELSNELIQASDEICHQLSDKNLIERCKQAIPDNLKVPGVDSHPQFLSIDFALYKGDDDKIHPKLIELQGFPTLYVYQYYLDEILRKHFYVPENFTCYYSNLSPEKYIHLFKKIVTGDENPENVILLEIEPHKQKTRIDFAATEELTGISTVCISDLIKKGNKLFYKKDLPTGQAGSKEIEVKRIYNRVIFDELNRTKVKYNFDFRDEFDVKWVCHPDWFFRISKFTLPMLTGKYVPNAFFVNELKSVPDDLQNYVLKPLFSFAGLGVKVEVTKEILQSIPDPENYILQEKINYAPLIETPDEKSKVEIRMMFLWDKEPTLVNNLIRTSKGKMMGVDFNKNKTWVGSSTAYHQSK
jgi:hypothetical protein